jgi:hypothetical protein
MKYVLRHFELNRTFRWDSATAQHESLNQFESVDAPSMLWAAFDKQQGLFWLFGVDLSFPGPLGGAFKRFRVIFSAQIVSFRGEEKLTSR